MFKRPLNYREIKQQKKRKTMYDYHKARQHSSLMFPFEDTIMMEDIIMNHIPIYIKTQIQTNALAKQWNKLNDTKKLNAHGLKTKEDELVPMFRQELFEITIHCNYPPKPKVLFPNLYEFANIVYFL